MRRLDGDLRLETKKVAIILGMVPKILASGCFAKETRFKDPRSAFLFLALVKESWRCMFGSGKGGALLRLCTFKNAGVVIQRHDSEGSGVTKNSAH